VEWKASCKHLQAEFVVDDVKIADRIDLTLHVDNVLVFKRPCITTKMAFVKPSSPTMPLHDRQKIMFE
jgi:hypothetical protein